ncbi:thiamine phosphate synthase [Clostridium psychrophilum]|uniref:thiamine phosphate synthase n=1 Tax=Clostridium psychrophilum TaxID=132926 RepID=UPI001C0D1255|nr:thiamine phosphate synthase [Clostridium psychrophilum]MBU3180831.1 thiamine phosphate synthase [Clostridium psychrophilum]
MIFLITNRKLACDKNFYEVIQEAIKAGIYAVILREKNLSYELLLPIAVRIKKIIGNTGVKLIINNNIEVAKAVEADGYHTNFESFINENLPFDGTRGVSVHSLEEAVEVEKHGANYILLGHIFKTDCKKGVPPRGTELIRTIKKHINIPIISLGGIHPSNTHLVMDAGSNGIAVMSSIMKAKDPYSLTCEYILSISKFKH